MGCDVECAILKVFPFDSLIRFMFIKPPFSSS